MIPRSLLVERPGLHDVLPFLALGDSPLPEAQLGRVVGC